MASKNAILRLAPLIRPKLTGANALRWDQLLGLLNDQGRAFLDEVLEALYPRQDHTAAMTAFRQFRRAVKLAAEQADVKLEIETDYQTRSVPSDRVVRLKAEDRIVENVERLVTAEIGKVDRRPQDAQEQRPLRIFVSYAHGDGRQTELLINQLKPLLGNSEIQLWQDKDILPGDPWEDEIKNAMKTCDLALLMLSPLFLISRFITKVELPYLLQNKRVVPVSLKPVPLEGNFKLHGIEERQIFFDAGRKSFLERETERTRAAFALELFRRIRAVLGERTALRLEYERHLRGAVSDFDEERFVHTEGTSSSMGNIPDAELAPRKDAIEFLMEWLKEEKAPPYCALLGEYGMGKTTTCKALARDLLDRRERGEKVPLPIYLDLRYVGESAKREPPLFEILSLIITRGWKTGPEGTSLTAKELIDLVLNEDTLVIWDGLDEVLVHLNTHQGQMFTRQLFRILPPRKNDERRGRLLISCRTHYFRTLQDQKTHFRAEDRDDVRAGDYRAFILLPFTPEQIQEYIRHTLPEEDPERVMEMFRSVHNLEEMAERPYTLSLIADREQFAQIERWKVEGRRVTGLTLYRHMVRSWLERDQGKHQLTTDHKQAIMEYVAAELWKAGARSWSIEDLEQWLIDFLEEHPRVAAHYHGVAREQLKEDLRTATFLVREGEDQFRFAHTSLQEFFLAGYLRRALVEGRPEAWELPRLSRETLDFR